MDPNTDSPAGILSLLRTLHRKEVGIIPRLILSIISGLVLTAVAMAGAWVIALAGPHYVGNSGITRFSVQDEYLLGSFAVCGFVWLASLVWIWRGTQTTKFRIGSILGTLGLWLVTIPAAVAIDELVRSEEEYLIVAVCLLSGALTLVIWLPTIERFRLGRPVIDSENLVNITCPECGYSLIGLRELRCPECGSQFTIDELIRRQDYGPAVTTPRESPNLHPPPFTRSIA